MDVLARGKKRICQGCGGRFYDLGRDPIVCPYCEAVFSVEASSRLKRSRGGSDESRKALEKKAKPVPVVEDVVESDDVEEEDISDDEAEDELLADDDELDGDDDVTKVIGGIGSEDRDV